jgi:hypothetical protein
LPPEREPDPALLSDLLYRNTGDTHEVVTWTPVEDGHHRNHHYILKTRENRWFGVKNSGGIEASRKEVLVSDLGRMAKVPLPRTVRLDPTGFGGGLAGLESVPVTKEEWTPIESATSMDPDRYPLTIQHVRENLPVFLEQFGEWTAFSVVAGLVDRVNPGNWIWNRKTSRLLMIDYEYAFMEEHRESESIAFLTNRFTPPLLRRPFENSQLVPLQEGFCSMRNRLRALWPDLSKTMRTSGLVSDDFILDRSKWMDFDEIKCLRLLFTGEG